MIRPDALQNGLVQILFLTVNGGLPNDIGVCVPQQPGNTMEDQTVSCRANTSDTAT